MTVSASAAETSSVIFVGPPKVAVSGSFALVRQIASPPRVTAPPRPPLDRPPTERWDAVPTVASASILALGTREAEMPTEAPAAGSALRRRLSPALVATVIRTGIPGGAFPGSNTVTAVQTSAPEPRRQPARKQPAPSSTASPQPVSPPPPSAASPPPRPALTTMQ